MMTEYNYISKSIVDTGTFAEKIVARIHEIRLHRMSQEEHALLICLYGSMGSGKTTLTQAIAKKLGFEKRVISPTFTIERIYSLEDGNSSLRHIDCFRLDDSASRSNGIIDAINDLDAITIVEWAEKIQSLLPKMRIDIHCSALVNGAHSFIIRDYYDHS
jgi:tRNA threonylcarbamoyladenosine biosynthesis protein TsaE